MEGPEVPNIHDTLTIDEAFNIYEVINWPSHGESHCVPMSTPLRNAGKVYSCS